ncbi:diaminobutyrate acetyltransferase [Luteipulveratus sp. YIM 133132]|uniref:L-2,4-diaminobutyric acid acetyltransferase n=1 Tax=Luteipulveratus flavus TaxID=3031728 RepID=A0ABT6C7W7_9MICO|nr:MULTISPECIES: diaminobutyrate acetyltransferase [unclassified Luteipulveratus]MDE9365770.1 diaminobutyrate acetyltransferase [Luteipulveratus sp. YIM 133132]MDF8264960.1 diaminobutyrate acetyltransferase [Luteipulveratus sp. YIM 133296]
MTSAILTPAAPATSSPTIAFRPPSVADGGDLWRIASDARTLDVNSSYAYLLWARDYARTSILAEVDGQPAGFVTGYTRPSAPQTLMVWQVAVDDGHRGRGIALRMLHELVDQVDDAATMETTITDDNTASIALFTRFAQQRGTIITREDLFGAEHFPEEHAPERLYRIRPLR